MSLRAVFLGGFMTRAIEQRPIVFRESEINIKFEICGLKFEVITKTLAKFRVREGDSPSSQLPGL